MPGCELCGNQDASTFDVITAGSRHTFDSFECAIHALAPVCERCRCRIIGHAVHVRDRTFCSVHCAEWTAPRSAAFDRSASGGDADDHV